MSSRYNSKKGNNIINKENESAPLNIIKKVQQPQPLMKKEVMVEKKPVIKQSKSLILQDIKPSENDAAAEFRGVEEAKKELCKEERKKDSSKFRKIETDRVMNAYAKNWMADMKSKQARSWPKNFLENHRISAGVRAKMIDWMIEVLCSYKCTDMTFFIAVNYMDMYFQRTAVKHELNDLHLIGVASMYVATKYEEICPLRISVMQSKISHGKFSKEEIKAKETDILQALNFECSPVTILNFLEIGIESLKLKETLSDSLYTHLVKLSVYIAKMVTHEYELLNKFTQCEFAVACIYIGLKIVQQLEPSFKIENFASELRTSFDISENVFFECSQNCLDLAKNFETKYPSLTNLAKFHSFSLDPSMAQDRPETDL
jgi:cyclin A